MISKATWAENGGDKFPRFSCSFFRLVWETRIGYFINIIKFCKWSCSQRANLSSDMTSSARFLPFHFTHHPSYLKDKSVSGATNTSEVVLEKVHWLPDQAWWATYKLTITVKSLINRHSKKQTPLINVDMTFSRITITQSNSHVWLSKRRTLLSN